MPIKASSRVISPIIFILIFLNISLSLAEVRTVASVEIGFDNSTSRYATEIMQNEWRSRALEFGACNGAGDYVTGDLSGAIVAGNEMTLAFAGINITLSNRDMDGPLNGSPGGNVILSTGNSLQDSAPRPESLYNSGRTTFLF